MTNVMEASTIPLQNAWLCPDCLSIGNRSAICPACSNTQLLSMARVLNRKPKEQAA